MKTLIGKGLFKFGDRDGAIGRAQLQHPLGVAYQDGKLYVSDTYNHKIKVIDLNKGKIRTLIGREAGFSDGPNGFLYEPAGLSIDEDILYIADTNNQAIRTYDLASGRLKTLEISPVREGLPFFTERMDLPVVRLAHGQSQIVLSLTLPKNHMFTEGDKVDYQFQKKPETIQVSPMNGRVERPTVKNLLRIQINGENLQKGELIGSMMIPYCTTTKPLLCKLKQVELHIPLEFHPKGRKKANVHFEILEEGYEGPFSL